MFARASLFTKSNNNKAVLFKKATKLIQLYRFVTLSKRKHYNSVNIHTSNLRMDYGRILLAVLKFLV